MTDEQMVKDAKDRLSAIGLTPIEMLGVNSLAARIMLKMHADKIPFRLCRAALYHALAMAEAIEKDDPD